jgi:hypothetical protein
MHQNDRRSPRIPIRTVTSQRGQDEAGAQASQQHPSLEHLGISARFSVQFNISPVFRRAEHAGNASGGGATRLVSRPLPRWRRVARSEDRRPGQAGPGGGTLPAGWSRGRTATPPPDNVQFNAMGRRAARDHRTGRDPLEGHRQGRRRFRCQAVFTETKARHAKAYGLFIAGKDLTGAGQCTPISSFGRTGSS